MVGTCYLGSVLISFVLGALLSVRFPPWEDFYEQKKTENMLFLVKSVGLTRSIKKTASPSHIRRAVIMGTVWSL